MYQIHQKLMKKRELKQKEKEMGASAADLETEEPIKAAPKSCDPPARAIPQTSFMNDAIIKKS